MRYDISLTIFILLVVLSTGTSALAQDTIPEAVVDTIPETVPEAVIDYGEKKEYEIGEVKITGAEFSDENAIRVVSGLKKGEKITIPGEKISSAIESLWRQKLFTDIQVIKEKEIGDVVFLEIVLQERPRLSKFTFIGSKKTYEEDLNELLKPFLLRGGIVTEATKMNSKTAIEGFFVKKGFLDAEVEIVEKEDPAVTNAIVLEFQIDRKDRVKIDDIIFAGNENAPDKKLRKQMENTKWRKKIFASSKFIESDFKDDLNRIIDYYNTIGYRDAIITKDTFWRDSEGKLYLGIDISEGNQYYFRNITWKGNSIYEDVALQDRLGIVAGDVYNQELLEQRLSFSLDGRDVSSLYMDNGYLFFRADPTEVSIENDSIDLEVRIFEGPQATIDRVEIMGNDRTHEHVIRRELRTKPGQKFSRAELIRSQRQIIALGYFNQETLGMNTPVNASRGTVDIEYTVEEQSSDQLELSAGYQPGNSFYRGGLIGTLGVTFNNFSIRNLFEGKAWSPLPQGDGQRLSLRGQTNGKFYQSYNFSFTEPWLGGKKPNSLTVAAYYTKSEQAFIGDNPPSFTIAQVSVGIGSRLQWPDDNFVSNSTLNFQRIGLHDFSNIFLLPDGTSIANGRFNNIYFQQTIARSTVAEPIFPKDGSTVSLSVQLTPPYSLFNNKDYDELDLQEKYRWIEYHKWKFTAEFYKTIWKNLVLKVSAKMGMLGSYNQEEVGQSPFERFEFAAAPLANQFTITGRDQVYFRGYETDDFPAQVTQTQNGRIISGASIFNKFSLELRYPVSLNPSSTIYVLAFADAGNAWNSFRSYDPFDLKRAAGAGLRVFLPMFGTLGFDYGFGFDNTSVHLTPGHKWTDFAKFTVILGFEPE